MMQLKNVFLILLCLSGSICLSQELPPIKNFSTLDYNSENQNWSIAQTTDKVIYVANNGGLLEFNGAKWNQYPSPNETIIRSVSAIDDKIYTGCYMEFGYWAKTKFGYLAYTSLSRKLGIELAEDEEIWKILGVDDWILFQSLNRIYIYDKMKETVSFIESDEVITKMFQVGEGIYFHRTNKGIFTIENSRDVPFITEDIFKEDEVVNLFKCDEGLLIITKNNGFYNFTDGELKKTGNYANDFISGLSIYNAIKLSNGNFALGTISDGLIYVNKDAGLLYEINQSAGLLNNTVLTVFEDMDGNIWSGLDNGISYININSGIKEYKDKRRGIGSVYTSAIYEDKLYLGTNQGLFYKPIKGEEEFRFIEGTRGQVWCLSVIGNTLFCGHHNGTFTINNDRATIVKGTSGTWNIISLNNYSDKIIQGSYDGLYILQRSDNVWSVRNKLKGFGNSSRYFEVLDQKIFVNHEYKGIFHLTVDKEFKEVINFSVDSTLKGANSSIKKYNGNVLYAYKNGIFVYDQPQNKFLKDSLLSNIYTEDDYISGRIVLNERDDEFWLFTKDNLTFVSSSNLANEPKIRTIPLTLKERRDVIEYENIIKIDDTGDYVLGTSSGYLSINIEELVIDDFNVFINRIFNGINQNHSASSNLIDHDVDGDFDSEQNNLFISFYTPEYYKYFKTNYQYRLVELYDQWSNWSLKSSVFYENLPPGDYTFEVRAKIGNKVSGNIASYQFHVGRPWYISNLMIALYVIGVILFSIFMHNVYRRYYRIQEEKLIEENTKALELARLQNEKEIIRIKNEQLEKDFKSKSKELAASTLSIVKKNELLMEIKDQLTNIQDKQTTNSVIKIIDSNLDHNENWEFFKEAFNNADSEFFKKVKSLHPDLLHTPGSVMVVPIGT
ncbi:MAG: triple tyrosine motif-containing protein [Bacteroidota bacterium]